MHVDGEALHLVVNGYLYLVVVVVVRSSLIGQMELAGGGG